MMDSIPGGVLRYIVSPVLHYYPNLLLILVLVRTFGLKKKSYIWHCAAALALLILNDMLKLSSFKMYRGTIRYLIIQFILIFLYISTAQLMSITSLNGWSWYQFLVIVMWWFFWESFRSILGYILTFPVEGTPYLFLTLNDIGITLFSIWIVHLHFDFGVHISKGIILILTLLSFFVETFVYNSDIHVPHRSIIVLSYICLGMVFSYWCIATILRQLSEIMENAFLDKLHRAEIEQSQQQYQEVRRIRHEYRNQMLLMSVLLQKKEYQELETYFQTFREETAQQMSLPSSGNEVIDAVLHTELEKAASRHIPVTVRAALPAKLRVPLTDLSAILFNGLDNAIEASENVPAPDIQLELKQIQGFVSVLIKNKVSGPVLQDNPLLQTTKSDAVNHGNGISIMRRAVARSHGDMEIRQDGEYVILSILLLESETQA